MVDNSMIPNFIKTNEITLTAFQEIIPKMIAPPADAGLGIIIFHLYILE